MTSFEIIQAARAAIVHAIENPETDEGLASAERALALLSAYLNEEIYYAH
jgi:hypothetical protein